MNFGKHIYDFYLNIKPPDFRLKGFEVMLPFETDEVREINREFYERYYSDNHKRIFLIGINPGRFGGGVTGIPFTDPINLEEVLGIRNSFNKKHELSSQFVYAVIQQSAGPKLFFGSLFLTAVSPLGFVKDNKNINYYDIKKLREEWESFFVDSLKRQLKAGGNKTVAFILGQGENSKYLKYLNDKYGFFESLIPLPHPRWVMQYRYKRREEYVNLYVKSLRPYLGKQK